MSWGEEERGGGGGVGEEGIPKTTPLFDDTFVYAHRF
jgi:hypothetical protein